MSRYSSAAAFSFGTLERSIPRARAISWLLTNGASTEAGETARIRAFQSACAAETVLLLPASAAFTKRPVLSEAGKLNRLSMPLS